MDFICVTSTFTLIFSFILLSIEHKIPILKFVTQFLWFTDLENDRIQRDLSDVWLLKIHSLETLFLPRIYKDREFLTLTVSYPNCKKWSFFLILSESWRRSTRWREIPGETVSSGERGLLRERSSNPSRCASVPGRSSGEPPAWKGRLSLKELVQAECRVKSQWRGADSPDRRRDSRSPSEGLDAQRGPAEGPPASGQGWGLLLLLLLLSRFSRVRLCATP